MQKVRTAVEESLEIHPRLRFQGWSEKDKSRLAALSSALPELPPYGQKSVSGVVALLDWDHRLPSQELFLRIHVCYEKKSLANLRKTVEERKKIILAQDRFPEFDVPDYGGLLGDESYECVLRPDLTVQSCQLVSTWKRQVTAADKNRAVATVLRSELFKTTRKAHPQRAGTADELEVTGHVPPCESGFPRWTIDVWWLTNVEGGIGRGWSFLVELTDPKNDLLIGQREFSIRLG